MTSNAGFRIAVPAALAAVGTVAACASFGSSGVVPGADAGVDAAGRETGAAACAETAPFATSNPLAGLESIAAFGPRLTPDERTVFFNVITPEGGTDIFFATRGDVEASFGAPTPFRALNTVYEDGNAMIAEDGLSILFAANRPGGVGAFDLYRSTRTTLEEPFGSSSLLLGISTAETEAEPFLSSDGRELWFVRATASGQQDLFWAAATEVGFGPAFGVPEIASGSDAMPVLSGDALTLYFASSRTGMPARIFRAHREGRDQPFGPPEVVAELASGEETSPAWLSADGCRLYLSRGVYAETRMYVAKR